MKHTPLILLTICLVTCITLPFNVEAESPLYVGVLENIKTFDQIPITSKIHVRIAFEKKGGIWRPMKTDFNTQETLSEANRYYPKTVNWTVIYNGKQIGKISSKDPGSYQAYGDIGTQIITTKTADIPQIRTAASDFWYSAYSARTRPLLLISVPNFKDPDDWKLTTLTANEKALAIETFRKKFPKMEQCKQPEEEPIYMVPYSNREIIFNKAYRSNKGEVLFGVRLSGAQSRCQFFDDENFFDYWFVLNKNENIRLIGSQMMPVDAADLDNSGSSEWVFLTSRGEDEDGYELFYGNFSKMVYFHWAYH